MLNEFVKLLKEVKEVNKHLTHSQAVALTVIIFNEERTQNEKVDFESLVAEFWEHHNEAKRHYGGHELYKANYKKIEVAIKIYDLIFKSENEVDENANNEFEKVAGKYGYYILKHKVAYMSPVYGSGKIDARIKFEN
jgi:hypothetical protein